METIGAHWRLGARREISNRSASAHREHRCGHADAIAARTTQCRRGIPLKNGFRRGQHRYQFFKDIQIGSGRTIPARLDLLTSTQHHEEFFASSEASLQPLHGVDIAFRDNSVLPVGPAGDVQIRVAGIAAFLTMKGIALHDRAPQRPKDAYDIHYCLEQYPDGLTGIVAEFERFRDDALVREALGKIAGKFRDDEDDGPRMVADVQEIIGDYRAIRKREVYTRVSDFLAALAAAQK